MSDEHELTPEQEVDAIWKAEHANSGSSRNRSEAAIRPSRSTHNSDNRANIERALRQKRRRPRREGRLKSCFRLEEPAATVRPMWVERSGSASFLPVSLLLTPVEQSVYDQCLNARVESVCDGGYVSMCSASPVRIMFDSSTDN